MVPSLPWVAQNDSSDYSYELAGRKHWENDRIESEEKSMARSTTEIVLLGLAVVLVLMGISVITMGLLAQRQPAMASSGIAPVSWLFGGVLVALGVWSAARAMR